MEVIENKIVTTPVITDAANIPNAMMLTIGVLLPTKLQTLMLNNNYIVKIYAGII